MFRSARMRSVVVALAVSLACTKEPSATANAVSRVTDLDGNAVDPLAVPRAVLLFVTTECPISNRYAPTFGSLASAHPQADFFFVYPDPDDDGAAIRQHQQDFGLSGSAIRDPNHVLVARAHATVTPEAAVFEGGELVYHGRIDDRATSFGEFRAVADQRDLDSALSALAAGREPATTRTKAIGCYIADLAD